MFYLRDDIKQFFKESDEETLFKRCMNLQGIVFRHQKNRMTQRVILDEKAYFIKQHKGIGFREIIKNVLQLRFPVTSAKNEWRAIAKLESLNVLTPRIAGFGLQGKNPARQESFILLEELADTISLEDFCRNWTSAKPEFALKKRLIKEVAQIAYKLHANGINHRDFYLCHFLLDVKNGVPKKQDALRLFLIDLHRTEVRRLTPMRWIIKDLVGLYFSSKDIGLTMRDIYRFIEAYRGKSIREILLTEKDYWEKVKIRGEQLYQEHAKR